MLLVMLLKMVSLQCIWQNAEQIQLAKSIGEFKSKIRPSNPRMKKEKKHNK